MSLLGPPDPDWPRPAAEEIARWIARVPSLLEVHHIGSTSVPGLPAKPIIDLLPVFESEAARDAAEAAVTSLGYEWMGPFGLPRRANARLSDAENGKRLFHADGYADGHTDIRCHLWVRDALRGNAALRAGYTSAKAACAARHPEGGAAYGEGKADWIAKIDVKTLERLT